MISREQWLAERRAGLGGSDVGAVLGLSPYKTPVDVWAEKTGRAIADVDTLQMRFGVYAEAFVASEYCKATGSTVQRFNPMLRMKDSVLLGNADRLVVPEGAKLAAHKTEIRTDKGLECKTANAFMAGKADVWGEDGSDQVPEAYLLQCSTYMALTGCQFWDLAVLFGNQELRVYHLERDLELEVELIRRANEWWNRHVVNDVAPEPVCEADIKWLYPHDKGTAIEADVWALDLIHSATMVAARIKSDELTLNGDPKAGALGIKGELKKYMGDAARLVHDGKDIVTWKFTKASQRFDVAAFKEAHPDIYKEFLKPGESSRRFLIK